ncbi:hypothetical protein IWQ62_004965 [Dispira parvispora]|uniref:Uncharacterized protein n=1 Tax=Dispira parvispora TaxID=1520584 RepID=A0A9W8E552_9FUNG|nr:hypothetical protein IWQ62_004965 [Dispira parvispora]
MRWTLSFQYSLAFGLVLSGTLMHHEVTALPHSLSWSNGAGKQSLFRRQAQTFFGSLKTFFRGTNKDKNKGGNSGDKGAKNESPTAAKSGDNAPKDAKPQASSSNKPETKAETSPPTNTGSQGAAQGGKSAPVGSTNEMVQNGAQTGAKTGISGGKAAAIGVGGVGVGAIAGHQMSHRNDPQDAQGFPVNQQ